MGSNGCSNVCCLCVKLLAALSYAHTRVNIPMCKYYPSVIGKEVGASDQ